MTGSSSSSLRERLNQVRKCISIQTFNNEGTAHPSEFEKFVVTCFAIEVIVKEKLANNVSLNYVSYFRKEFGRSQEQVHKLLFSAGVLRVLHDLIPLPHTYELCHYLSQRTGNDPKALRDLWISTIASNQDFGLPAQNAPPQDPVNLKRKALSTSNGQDSSNERNDGRIRRRSFESLPALRRSSADSYHLFPPHALLPLDPNHATASSEQAVEHNPTASRPNLSASATLSTLRLPGIHSINDPASISRPSSKDGGRRSSFPDQMTLTKPSPIFAPHPHVHTLPTSSTYPNPHTATNYPTLTPRGRPLHSSHSSPSLAEQRAIQADFAACQASMISLAKRGYQLAPFIGGVWKEEPITEWRIIPMMGLRREVGMHSTAVDSLEEMVRGDVMQGDFKRGRKF